MSLLTPELLRRLEQFQLLAARRAKSSAKGERRSRARGQSIEFADHRSYVPGDGWSPLARLPGAERVEGVAQPVDPPG